MEVYVDKEEISRLIISSQEGDEKAFNELYNSTNSVIYHSIYSILNDRDLSLDVVQETYLKVLKNKMKSSENGLAYLITIAKNLALNVLKSRNREIPIDFEEEELMYRKVEDKEYSNDLHIQDVMDKYLSQNQKELIRLHVMEGLTHREIALKLNKPIGTIMWQYNEAIKELRKRMSV